MQRILILYQNSYIDKLIVKFNVNTLIKASEASLNFYEQIKKNLNQTTAQQILAYQQRIESINFIAITIKSDVAFAAFKLSEFLINSLSQYIKAVNRIFKYLTHIKDYEIVFNA